MSIFEIFERNAGGPAPLLHSPLAHFLFQPPARNWCWKLVRGKELEMTRESHVVGGFAFQSDCWQAREEGRISEPDAILGGQLGDLPLP